MSNFITALIKQRNDAKTSDTSSGRLKEIIDILNKYNYDDGITPEIMVNILQDLGPTFVKLGQLASQQSEAIPPEYCDALIKLRSSVAPMDTETVHAQIEKYLGVPVEELFSSFDDKPLGSASIGQVHKATLHDGTVVAVKVRRPGVVDTVARDFALIEKILDFNDKLSKGKSGGFDLKAIIAELENTSKLELDFTNEARNLERFWENNQGRDYVSSPKCYTDYTNEAILTEDFVEGDEAGNAAFLTTLDDSERDRLALLVADSYASQVLVDGFYHADPHSGNVLVRLVPVVKSEEAEAAEEGEKNQTAEPEADEEGEKDSTAEGEAAEEEMAYGITWIDFGMMGSLTAKQQQLLTDLVASLLKQDAYGMKRIVLQVATPKVEIDHGAMLEMCETMCNQSTGTDLGEFSLGDLLGMVLGNLQDENYDIDPFLTNLARGIIAAEGTVRTISPRVNILNCFIDKVKIGFNPKDIDLEKTVTSFVTKALQGADDKSALPTKAIETLDMLEKGQITLHNSVNFDEKSAKVMRKLARNAIVAAFDIALLIGSCIMCLMPSDSVTRIAGIPSIGFVGYIVSLIFIYLTFKKVNKDN